MSLLILGSKGQLGFELCRQASGKGLSATSCDLPEFNITDVNAIQERIKNSGCKVAINATAYTAVDKAEHEKELAFAVNAEGPQNLARICKENGIPLVHISTDYVFDGRKKGAYQELDPVCPISVYGKSKAEGEAAVRDALEKHIIVRTAWLYGEHGNNFVKTMLRLGAERESLSVVYDQTGNPTCAADLAQAILDIAEHLLSGKDVHWGTYHYAGKGITSWHAFAEAIFNEAKKYRRLQIEKVGSITSDQYPTPAARPKNSVLNCSKIEAHFGILTKPWRKSLNTTIGNLLHS